MPTKINWTREGYSDSYTAEAEGFALRLTMEHDSSHGAPWEEEDGHGPVSGWGYKCDKKPGELILNEDRDGTVRFYDFAEACRIALKEGWGSKGDEGLSPRAKAAKAARADFEHLRRWCNDEWSYQVLCVTASKNGIELGTAYLGGVAVDDSDSDWDADATAREYGEDLASEAIAEAKATLKRLAA